MDTSNTTQSDTTPKASLTLNRRQLLKAMLAAGGAASLATLPTLWTEPKVEVGVLPAHAQVSPTLTPSPTPVIYAIRAVYVENAVGGTSVLHSTDTLRTYAYILPMAANIDLSIKLVVLESGHPQVGQIIAQTTGITDSNGRSFNFDFNLGSLSTLLSPGSARLEVLWEFVDLNNKNYGSLRVDIAS